MRFLRPHLTAGSRPSLSSAITPSSVNSPLLEKREHQAVARSVEDTEVFFIQKDDLKKLEETEPMIMLKIYRKIAIVAGHNVRRMNEKLMNVLVSY